jgi:TatD DNase family protein
LQQDLPYFISAGLHPWFVEKYPQSVLIEKLELAMKHPKTRAIGEIGLDKYAPNKPLQKEVFKLQLALATKHQKPIIIHQVGMSAELGLNLTDFSGRIVLHGYQDHIQVWEQLSKKHTVYASVGKAIMHKNAKLVQTVKELPINRLLIETDGSSLRIDAIYEQIARVKQCSLEELIGQIEQNFIEVFGAY